MTWHCAACGEFSPRMRKGRGFEKTDLFRSVLRRGLSLYETRPVRLTTWQDAFLLAAGEGPAAELGFDVFGHMTRSYAAG